MDITTNTDTTQIPIPISPAIALDALKKQWIGASVKILTSEFGWGDVCKNDIGIVVSVELPNILILDVLPGDNFNGVKNWRCMVKDVSMNKATIDVNDKARKYIQFMAVRSKLITEKRTQALEQIRQKEEEIYHLITEQNDMNTLLKSALSKHSAMTTDKISNMFKVIETIFTDIYFEGTSIVATTIPINMAFVDRDNKIITLPMGVYQIILDVASSSNGIKFVKMNTGATENTIVQSYIHPHIPSDGYPCWGTWRKAIMDYHKEQEYIGELKVAYDFLCNADKGGWYINAYAFSKDADKRCDSCWELTDNCECNICQYCENHIDNCSCQRCPDTDDIIEDRSNYCSECEYYGDHGCEY
jgi:hypothetical protein